MRRRNQRWEITTGPLPNCTDRQVLWQNSESTQPSLEDLSRILSTDISDLQLSDVSSQILKHAPTSALPSLLGGLTCCYWRSGSNLDFTKVQNISLNAQKSICGKVFKKGDLVWNCRQCSKDPTCVQCDPCFKKSNHQGHEVYFHRSSGGSGCCDCGDSEAWASEGNCTEHNCSEQGESSDPTQDLPVSFKRGLRAVLKGVISIMVSYCVAFVRSLEPAERNEFFNLLKDSNPDEKVVASLHNDDVHTFDQVISALRSINLNPQESQNLTQAVDRDGFAAIFTDDVSSSRIENAFEKLSQRAGLLFSVMPVDLFPMMMSVHATLQWMLNLGEMHDGIRRVICEELAFDILLAPSTYNFSALSKHQVYRRYACSEIFNEPSQFPSEVNQLAPIETLRLCLSSRMSTQIAEEPTSEREFKDRVRYPFNYCPKTPLAIIILSCPFLPPMVSSAFQSLVIRFQHDYVFKVVYSQLFTILYPTLSFLYNRHFGTAEGSLFQTSVQFYTARSVAELMSTKALGKRYLSEPNNAVLVCNMLISTLYGVLLDQGCVYASKQSPSYHNAINKFLNQHSIRNKRFELIPRDFEYLVKDADFSLPLLAGVSDSGVVELWLDVCKLLQDINRYLSMFTPLIRSPLILFYFLGNSMQRRTDTHIEREDTLWQHAADMVLDIEAAISHFLSHALFSDTPQGLTISNNTSCKADYPRVDFILLRQSSVLTCVKKITYALLSWMMDSTTSLEKSLSVTFDDLHLDVQRNVMITFKKFSVLTDYVSVHIPLNRFLSKLFCFACYGNVDLQAVFGYLRAHYNSNDSSSMLTFVDYSIRCLAFSNTVENSMWRRNGMAPVNLIYNYNRPPLCKSLRDMDMLAIQVGLLTMDSAQLLLFLLDRLEVLFVLAKFRTSSSVPEEYRPGLIRGFLKVLVQVFGYPPIALSNEGDVQGIEGPERALSRELFHHIFSGTGSIAELNKVKHMVGTGETISDSTFHNVLQTLCDVSTGDVETKLVLKEESHHYCDPFFPNISGKRSEALLDRMRNRLSNQLDSKGNYNKNEKYPFNKFCPLLLPEYLPTPHKDFADLKNELFGSFFIHILHSILQYTSQNHSSQHISSIIYVLHIVNMQLHEIEKFLTNNFTGAVHQIIGNLQPILEDLCSLWNSEILKSDVLFHHALGYVLVQFMFYANFKDLRSRYQIGNSHELKLEGFNANKAMDDLFQSLSIHVDEDGEGPNNGSKEIEKSASQGKLAAQKAILEAQQKARQMLEAFANEMSDSENEEENTNSGEKRKQDHTCIICKIKSSQPIGLLCFVQSSNVHRHIIASSVEELYGEDLYRVVSRKGCDVHAQPSPDSQLIQNLAFNSHVTVVRRIGQWAQIKEPLEGYVKFYESRSISIDVKEQNQVLTKFCSDTTTILQPFQQLWFNKHGGSRIIGSTCSHAMHFACWDEFYTASYAQALNQYRDLNSVVYDVSLGECLCPMCKTLVNTIVPIHEVATAASSTSNFYHDLSLSPQLLKINMLQSALSFQRFATEQPLEASLLPFHRRFYDACTGLRYATTGVVNIGEEKYQRNNLGEDLFSFASGRSAHVGVRTSKMFHSVTSVVASTLTCLSHHYLKGEVGSNAVREVDKIFCFQLLQLVLGYVSTTSLDCVNNVRVVEYITHDFFSTMFPDLSRKRGELVADIDLDQAISSFPYQVVMNSLYPNESTIYNVLKAHNRQYNGSVPTLWGFLQAPILTMDLNAVLMVCVGIVGDHERFASFLPYLILVKVSQLLLDPVVTGLHEINVTGAVKTINRLAQDELIESQVLKKMKTQHDSQEASTSSESNLFVETLQALQVGLCDQAAVPLLSSALTIQAIDYIADSLVPFLHYVVTVYLAMGAFEDEDNFTSLLHISSDSLDLEMAISYANAIFQKLAVPYSLLQFLQSSQIAPICAAWAAHLKQHFQADKNKQGHGGISAGQMQGLRESTAINQSETNPSPRQQGQDSLDIAKSQDGNDEVEEKEEENEFDEEGEEFEVDEASADDYEVELEDEGIPGFTNIEDGEDGEDDDDEDMIGNILRNAGNELNLPQGLDLATLPPELRNLLESNIGFFGSRNTSSTTNKSKWRLLGIYPHNPYVDEVVDTQDILQLVPLQYHSFSPFVGSFCGAYYSYALNGSLISVKYPDFSHFNFQLSAIRNAKLINLPQAYTDLYHIAHYPQGEDCVSIEEPALCLICGTVLAAGNRPTVGRESEQNPGECTLHSVSCGAGIGLYFLVHSCKVLLMRGGRSCYSPSIYVDETGEGGESRGHSRPMYLSTKRYQALHDMYFSHNVAKEVARKRLTSDTVVRQFWY